MDTLDNLKIAASSKGVWFLRCWSLRKQVWDLLHKVQDLKDEKRLLELQQAKLIEDYEKQLGEYKKAREGNRALVQFIHRRHRLNVPIDNGSIRELLQKVDE